MKNDLFEQIISELSKPKLPSLYYNKDGEQIEVFHSSDSYYAEWIDSNLTLYKKDKDVNLSDPAPDKIIGYEITDLFGLLRKSFGKEVADKIKYIIDNHLEQNKDIENGK